MSRTVGVQSTTPARVATSVTVATLLAAGTNRSMVRIQNEAAATLYVKLGATASATDYSISMPANSYYEFPSGDPYAGIITGTLASGTGFAQVTAY